MSIIIKCNIKDGFRRGGIRHPKGSTEYPDGTFSAKQIAELKDEKNLIVEITAPKDPYEEMTKAELLEKIKQYQPIETLGKEKKSDLIEMLKAHEGVAAKADEA